METVDAARPDPRVPLTVGADDLTAVREMVVGYQVSQIVYAACDLAVIDHIADGVLDVPHLAAMTQTPIHTLELLLDCLAGLGLLIADGSGRYRLTEDRPDWGTVPSYEPASHP